MSSNIGVSNTLRVVSQPKQNEVTEVVKSAKIKYRKIKSTDKYTVYGAWTEDYAYSVVTEATNSDEKLAELKNRYKFLTFKPTTYTTHYLNNCYKIDYIEAPQRYKGEGTKAVKALLERSLSDKDTQGRIVVNAEIIDGKSSPAGFFYKLGFRFIDKKMNETMEAWLEEKTILNAPMLTGMMYLPKENINKLLRYGENLL